MGRATNAGAPASNKEEIILDTALRLFAERGVEGASMNDIAEAVGIRKPTIYHYYPSKEAIIEAIFASSPVNADWLRGAMQRHEIPLFERLVSVGELFLKTIRSRPHFQVLMVRESIGRADPPWRARLRRLLRAHIQGRIDALAEAFTSEIDGLPATEADLLASHFFHSITSFWLFEGHVASEPPTWKRCSDYVELIARMVSRQLAIQSPADYVESID